MLPYASRWKSLKNALISPVRFGVTMKTMPIVMKKNPKEMRLSQSVPFERRP